MAAANAFVNGFMGGMGAMNTMIDSKARREHQAWQKEMTLQDREIAAQERDYINQERHRAEGLRQTAGIMHWYENASKEDKQKAEQYVYEQWRNDPAISAMFNNNNPNEFSEFSHLKPVHDKNGKLMGMQPVLNVYDSETSNKNRKLLRTGGLTDGREKGGNEMYLPTSDLVEYLASDQMADTRLALETSYVMQGGTPKGRKERWSDVREKDGQFYITNLDSNESKTVGHRRTKGDGSGSGGIGGGGKPTYEREWKESDPRDPNGQREMSVKILRYPDGTRTRLEIYNDGSYREDLANDLNAPQVKQGMSVLDVELSPSQSANNQQPPPPPPVKKPEKVKTTTEPGVNKSNAAAVLKANPGMMEAISNQEVMSQNANRAVEDIMRRLNIGWDVAVDILRKRGTTAGTEYRGGMNDA